jgi:UDP-glucose 4-epimerase
MRALVTGGAGFIGSHLVDALVRRGDSVVVLDDLSTGSAAQVSPAAELVVGDIADRAAVDAAMRGCEVVFHQAARGSVQRSLEHPLETDRVNVAGTLTVLLAAQRAALRRVVLASSSSIYGGAAERPTPESATPTPRSPYSVSKLAGEHYARVAWELHGLETVCLRYFNVFGPRQDPASQYAAVVPRFIDALARREAPVVYGDGRQTRDFTYVADVVRANLCAEATAADICAGHVYNVARGEPHTVRDLVAILQEQLEASIDPCYVEGRAGDVRHSHADISAARRDLGYAPLVSLRDGLADTVRWFAASAPAEELAG